MKIARIDDIVLIPKAELERRLAKMRRARGEHPRPGPGISLACVVMATGLNRAMVLQSSYGRNTNGGTMSNRTQLLLSGFFARYDAGEISFFYRSRVGSQRGSGRWEMIYHSEPVAREETVAKVTIGEDGPKLGFAKMNRAWV